MQTERNSALAERRGVEMGLPSLYSSFINDLSAEKQYKVSLSPPRATRAPLVVPQWAKDAGQEG
jgi:hypothetical protein